jgi:homoserine dehydrogenase
MEIDRVVRVGLAGVGSVGKTLLTILRDKKDELQRNYGLRVQVVVLGDSSGFIGDINGFEINDILLVKQKGGKMKDIKPIETFESCISKNNINLLFESTPVDIKVAIRTIDKLLL